VRIVAVLVLGCATAHADTALGVGVHAALVPGASGSDHGRWLGLATAIDHGLGAHLSLHGQLALDDVAITSDISGPHGTQLLALAGIRYDFSPRDEPGTHAFLAAAVGGAWFRTSPNDKLAFAAAPLDVGIDIGGDRTTSVQLRLEGAAMLDYITPEYFLALVGEVSVVGRL
jgi:hypothetical protein